MDLISLYFHEVHQTAQRCSTFKSRHLRLRMILTLLPSGRHPPPCEFKLPYPASTATAHPLQNRAVPRCLSVLPL